MGQDALIVAIVFGSILGMITIPMLFNLAKKWIDRNNSSYDDEKFDKLAKAFISHKKEMDRRVKNLEAIIAGDKSNAVSAPAESTRQTTEKKKDHESIEIDSHKESDKDRDQSDSGNLRNMLKE